MAITSTNTQNASNATTTVCALPSTAAAGDLIVVVCGLDFASSTSTSSPTCTELKDEGSTDVWIWIGYLKATGGETAITLTHTTERGNAFAFLIPAAEWHGTTVPEIVASAASGTSTAPDSGSITPSWGAEANTYFWSIIIMDDNPTNPFPVTAFPTNYSLVQVSNAGPSSSAAVAVAIRQTNAATEDPGAWAVTVSEHWVAYTMAVRGAVATVPPPLRLPQTIFQPQAAQ